MDQESFDIYKVPAYKRRGSIDARARKFAIPERKKDVAPATSYSAPIPQAIDRRKIAQAAQNFFNEGKNMYVRDMGARAAEQFAPSSVPRSVIQKVKDRMVKDEEHAHSLWGDDEFEQASQVMPSTRRMKCLGIVTHYFEKIQVCVIDLIDGVEIGNRLIFEEEDHYLFEELLNSMQIDRQDVGRALKGQQIGVKIQTVPKLGGKVWKVMA